MKPVPEDIGPDQLLDKMILRMHQSLYRVGVGLVLADGEPVSAERVSDVTVEEVLDKVKGFLDSNPVDEHYIVFLHYLAKYPVSMCKRQVSPILKHLIGFHYRFGQMFKKDYERARAVSMEDLSEIFGRSKATIHECIKDTEENWREFQELMEREKEVEAKAERELIEEAKERLRKEKQPETFLTT